jgi:hypothetical protein
LITKPNNGLVNKYYYKYDEINYSNVYQFLSDYNNDKLTKHYDSEKMHTNENIGITTIVNDTFEEILDKNKNYDVLLFVCSKFSDLSNKLQKSVYKIGEMAKDVENIKVCSMNYDLNEYNPNYLDEDKAPLLKIYTKSGKVHDYFEYLKNIEGMENEEVYSIELIFNFISKYFENDVLGIFSKKIQEINTFEKLKKNCLDLLFRVKNIDFKSDEILYLIESIEINLDSNDFFILNDHFLKLKKYFL